MVDPTARSTSAYDLHEHPRRDVQLARGYLEQVSLDDRSSMAGSPAIDPSASDTLVYGMRRSWALVQSLRPMRLELGHEIRDDIFDRRLCVLCMT
jgi:hypothetical protein